MLGRLPIRWRLTLFQTITMAIIVIGLILAMYAVLGIDRERRLREHVADCARVGQTLIDRGETLDTGVANSMNCSGVAYAVLDENGTVLDAIGGMIETGERFPDDFWREALATSTSAGARLTDPQDVFDEPRYAYAAPLSAPDSDARVVVASLAYATIGNDSIFITSTIVSGIAIFTLIVLLIASYFLVRSSLAPVNAITSAARQISGSDLSRRLPVENPRDELGRLSGTFNDLLDRLEVAFVQRERALEEQRRFVADASHELRTPLTSILGYTRMLKSWGLSNPATAREGLEALELEAERMHRLIESLLRIARGDELPAIYRQQSDLGPIVREAVGISHDPKEDGTGVITDVPDTSIQANVDQGAIMQAIEILVDNAITHADSSSPIVVSLAANDEEALICVRDEGQGIAPEDLPHLFERFYRADSARATRGSGLGLSIARQIIAQHDGTIDVASAPGEGTTFTIRLPRSRPG